MFTEHLPIGDLLSNRVPFEIPKYQRAYAWDKDEIDDFTHDVLSLFAYNQANPQNTRYHFFGGIVCIHINVPATQFGRKFEVVDGQQRLATFALSLHQLANALGRISQLASQTDPQIAVEANAHAGQLKRAFLEYEDVENGVAVSKPRLTLSRADRTFFMGLVNGQHPPENRESHTRMKNAYGSIAEKLTAPITEDPNLSFRQKLDSILFLKKTITESCYVIHIYTPDRKEAYTLFTVLNDRGTSLSDGDLLRSHTLELLEGHPQFQEQAEIYWDEILSKKQSNIDRFLRTYYTSIVGERAPVRNLYDSYNSNIISYTQPLSNADASTLEQRIFSIKDEAEVYANLAEGIWPSANDNNNISEWDRHRLRWLSNVLKHALCFPLLLSARRCLQETDFSEMVHLLEKFAFRYIVVTSAHPGTIQDKYYNFAKMIRDNPANFRIADLRHELGDSMNRHAPDELFERKLLVELDYSQSSNRRLIGYFLSTLESYRQWFEQGAHGTPRPDRMILYTLDNITIEHIYPQNPPANLIDQSIHDVKHQIGNLTFWGPNDNRAAGNESFIAKKARYANSNVGLTRELSNLNGWSKQEFDTRQQRLLEMAKKIFKI